jgi:hypothetical protein
VNEERTEKNEKQREAPVEGRRKKKKIQRNRSSVLSVPPPVFLFAATSNTANTNITSTKPPREARTLLTEGTKKQRKKTIHRNRGEKKENQCLPP